MDLLLANVLLELVLFTAALAVAHALCEVVFALYPGVSKAFRIRLRVTATIGMCGLSMWLFARQNAGTTGSMKQGLKQPEMLARIHKSAVTEDALSARSVTTLAPVSRTIAVNVNWRMATNVNFSSMETCKAWLNSLKQWGSSIIEQYAHADGLLLCVSEPISDVLQRRFLGGDLKSKKVFFVGPVHRQNAAFLSKLLDVSGWMEGHPSANTFVTVRRRISGELPPGLSMNFGKYFHDTERHYFARTNDAEVMLVDADFRLFRSNYHSALITRNRMAWTSLPPRLYGANGFLYAQVWNALWADVFRIIQDHPRAAVQSNHVSSNANISFALSVDRKNLPIEKILLFCKSMGLVINLYVNPSFLEDYESELRSAMADGHGVGILVSRRFDERRLQSVASGALARLRFMSRSDNYPAGALVTGEGFSATTVATLKFSGFRHVRSDVYADRLVPYALKQFQGDGALKQEEQNTPGKSIYIVPFFGGFQSAEGLKSLLTKAKLATELGGPFAVSIHLDQSNASSIQDTIKGLAQAGHSFVGDATLVKRQAIVDSLTIETERRDQSWLMNIVNRSHEDFQNIHLTVGAGWALSDGSLPLLSKNAYLVEAIEGGEGKAVSLNRESNRD